MRLSEIVHIAKITELKQIVVGEDEDQVIGLLNLALIEVYGRLNLIQEEQIIPVHSGQTRYLLQDNSLRLISVFTQDGDELPVNDPNDNRSIYNPTPFELHVTEPHMRGGDESPYDKPLTRMSVLMSTTPPYVTKANIDILDLVVPTWALESILSYMAYRAFLSMNGDQQSEAGSQAARYEKSIKDIYNRGFLNQGVLTNLKSEAGGFV